MSPNKPVPNNSMVDGSGTVDAAGDKLSALVLPATLVRLTVEETPRPPGGNSKYFGLEPLSAQLKKVADPVVEKSVVAPFLPQDVGAEVSAPVPSVTKLPVVPCRPPSNGALNVVTRPPLLKSKVTDCRSVAVQVWPKLFNPPLSRVTVILAACPADSPAIVVFKSYRCIQN